MVIRGLCSFFFFFNDTATTEIYTLSLHDALPISGDPRPPQARQRQAEQLAAQRVVHRGGQVERCTEGDRKSTRLNSSHSQISYAVFCLKKKKQNPQHTTRQQLYPNPLQEIHSKGS